MLLPDDFLHMLSPDGYAEARYRESGAEVPVLSGESAFGRRRRERSYFNLKRFMQTLPDRMDRPGMFPGLEARVPFADRRSIGYLFKVPWSVKRRNGGEKSLLRRACGDLLPEKILRRKKSPYPKTCNPNYGRIPAERLRAAACDPQAPTAAPPDKERRCSPFPEAPAEYGRPRFGQLMAGPSSVSPPAGFCLQNRFFPL